MSYASKAQLKTLAEAIKARYAKKIDPEARVGLANNLFTDQGPLIDAGVTTASGDTYPDRPNNAKGTGTFFPHGSTDFVTVENGNETIEKVYGHSYVKNQLVDTDTNEVATVSGRKYLTILSGESAIVTGDGEAIAVASGDKVYDLSLWFGGSVPADLTVNQFFRMYPNAYNLGYTEPTIVDAEDFTYSSSGINLFDEDIVTDWQLASPMALIRSRNKIRVIPGATYHLKTSYRIQSYSYYVARYDKDGNLIYVDRIYTSEYTIPKNTWYVYIGLPTSYYGDTYKFDTQFCLHYTDTSVENTYHPYIAPATKEIHFYDGVGRSAGAVCDEVDYVAKKRIKRITKYDFATGTSAFSSLYTMYFASAKKASNVLIPGLVRGVDYEWNTLQTNPFIEIRTAFRTAHNITTPTECTNYFKNNGYVFYYETATPLEEDITDLIEQNNVLPCNDYGIESKSDGVVCGMKVQYQLNPLRTIFNNKSSVETLKEDTGNVDSLTTTEKSNLVAAINELVARVAALEGGNE